MEIRQIKELMAAMTRCGMSKLHLKKGGFELQLERSNGANERHSALADDQEEGALRFAQHPPRANAPLPKSTDAMPVLNNSSEERKVDAGQFITSPMVGTYYSSPSPEDPPFIKAGQKVEKGDVICIVEAMKVMNEIKAQVAGTIVELMVENGSPVEFGTKLFRIE